jgi:predicted protein tyrosine phosphatase
MNRSGNVMKKIYIKSEREIGPFIETLGKDFILISITSPAEDHVKILPNDHNRGVLRLKFHDIESPIGGYSHFTSSQAASIRAFIESNHSTDTIVCQCEAGISRSAGVAAALTKYYGMDETIIFTGGRWMPNILVYQKLLQAFRIPLGGSAAYLQNQRYMNLYDNGC